jgi:DNA protecting protein DprA
MDPITYCHPPFVTPDSRPLWRIKCLDDPESWLRNLPDSGFSIVGTRKPQGRSLRLVDETVKSLKNSGLTVISGLARGIDEAAHRAALQAGLRTLAILGSGVDVDYPSGSSRLKSEILESGGMLLSPFPDRSPPLPGHFHERNQLIARLAKAVWVVEGAAVSGTLNTAHWASRWDRDLYATPAFPGDPFFSGNEKLLSREQPERHPFASPFYGIRSLLDTWPRLLEPQAVLAPILLPQHPLDRLVVRLESELGECRLPVLQEHWSPGDWNAFSRDLQEAIESRRIRIEPCGRIRVQSLEKS